MDININPYDIDNVYRKLTSRNTEILQIIFKLSTKLKRDELLKKREQQSTRNREYTSIKVLQNIMI